MGAQARKKFLTSRAASPGRKPPVTGGTQADLRVRREASNSSSLIPHVNVCPTQIPLCEHKCIKVKTQLLVLQFQIPTISLPACLFLAQNTTAASPISQSKVMVFVAHTLMKSPYTKQIQLQTFATNYGIADQSSSLQIAC